jgi:hypothetical protein
VTALTFFGVRATRTTSVQTTYLVKTAATLKAAGMITATVPQTFWRVCSLKHSKSHRLLCVSLTRPKVDAQTDH